MSYGLRDPGNVRGWKDRLRGAYAVMLSQVKAVKLGALSVLDQMKIGILQLLYWPYYSDSRFWRHFSPILIPIIFDVVTPSPKNVQKVQIIIKERYLEKHLISQRFDYDSGIIWQFKKMEVFFWSISFLLQ